MYLSQHYSKTPTRDIRREDATIPCDRMIDACSREVQYEPQAQADFRRLQSKVRRSIFSRALGWRARHPDPLSQQSRHTTKVFYHVGFLAPVC